VPIDTLRAEALLKLDWVKARLASEGVAFEVIDDWGYFLPLKANNECVFWDETLHCLIHHHQGADAKPLDCQRFPFARLPHADANEALRYDVSAACSTVAKSHLFLWNNPVQPAELEQQATASQDLPSPFHPTHLQDVQSYARFPFPFHGFQRFSRDYFQAFIETEVLPLLQDDTLSPWQAIRAVQDLTLSKSRKTQGALDPTPQQRHALLSTWLRSEYGNFPLWQWRFWGRYQDPRLFGDAVITEKALAGVDFPADLMDRYGKPFLFHLLRRESPLLYGASFWHSVVMAKIAYVLLDFYSKAFTLQCEESVVGEEQVQLAIRCIERYYTAHQPRFLAKIEANPHLALGVWCL
jgi:hypothetical protein